MRKILIIFLCMLAQWSFAQSVNKMLKQATKFHTIVYAYEGTDKIVANVYKGEKEIKTDETKYYYWFSSSEIKKTKGAYSGKILDGEYIVYYANKDLKTKGVFKLGLRHGRWASWYPNGEYSSVYHYKKGYQHGPYKMYDTSGVVREEGEYDKDKREGVFKQYHADGTSLVLTYKDGELIKEKHKKSKQKAVKIKGRKNIETPPPVEAPADGGNVPDKNKKQKKSKGKKEQIRIKRSIHIFPMHKDDET